MTRMMPMTDATHRRSAGLLTPRLTRALAAGAGAGLLAGTAPAWVLEGLTMATGLAAVFPPAAPPLGFTARMLFAIAAAASALLLVWALWRPRISAPRKRQTHGESLSRAAGQMGETPSPAATLAEPVSGGLLGRLKAVLGGRAHSDDEDRDDAMLSRRRADRHPDAPPRAPLVASRDLPSVDEVAPSLRKRSLVVGEPAPARPGDPWATIPAPASESNEALPGLGPDFAMEPAIAPAAPAQVADLGVTDPVLEQMWSPTPEPEPSLAPEPTVQPQLDPVDDLSWMPTSAPDTASPEGPSREPISFEPISFEPVSFEPVSFEPLKPIETMPLDAAATNIASAPPVTVPDLSAPLPASMIEPRLVEPIWPQDDWSAQAPARSLSCADVVAEDTLSERTMPVAMPLEVPIVTAQQAPQPAPVDPLPPLPSDDLVTLAARFETGLARREAISHADNAARTLQARIGLADQDDAVRAALRGLRPVAAVPDAPKDQSLSARLGAFTQDEAANAGLDQNVDMALEQALGTLRRLTELGRR
jgi:hypothetical protein